METSTNEVTNPSGFVAGTLVHTRDGLIPIEQIKAGDWVLSRQENSKVGSYYSRVATVHEYLDREVYLVTGKIRENNSFRQSGEPIAATDNQLFWIPKLQDDDEVCEVSAWASIGRLWSLLSYDSIFLYPMFELQDGRMAQCGCRDPILRTANKDIGLLLDDPKDFMEYPDGLMVDFSAGYPQLGESIWLDIERDEVHCAEGDDSIYYRSCGCHPILRTIYGIDVEDTHTYFVGSIGMLVHDGTHAHNANFPDSAQLRSRFQPIQ